MISPMKREDAAYHEAGHAVLAWALGCKVRVVSIRADGSGGECQCEEAVEGEGKFILCFAGPASQRTHGSVDSWHGGRDYVQAVEAAESFGISDERASKLIDKAHELVAEQWEGIERVADALVERGMLNTAEIEALLGPTPDRVKLTEHQRRIIVEWAERVRLVEIVRLYGSRAKGFARSWSDVDLTITASTNVYWTSANHWQKTLSDTLDLPVKLTQYNCPEPNLTRIYCNSFNEPLFERSEARESLRR